MSKDTIMGRGPRRKRGRTTRFTSSALYYLNVIIHNLGPPKNTSHLFIKEHKRKMKNKMWNSDTKYQLWRNTNDTSNIGAMDQKEENDFKNEYAVTL